MVKFSCFRRVAVLTMLIIGMSIVGRAQSFDAEGFRFRIISVQKNEAKILGMSSGVEAPSSLVIPYTVSFNGRTFNIISMADSAFMNVPVESITLPDSIKVISNYAFADCENLTEIIISKQLTSIGQGAFRNCRKLKEVDARSSNVADIGRDAFLNCESLVDFLSSSTVTNVGISAFKNCTALREFAFSQVSRTEVGDSAFFNARSLKRIITNPDIDNCKETYIGTSAFEYSGLTGDLRVCMSFDYNNGSKAFAHTDITSVNSKIYHYMYLKYVPDSTFAFCDNLTSVNLANSGTFGRGVFYGCNNLKTAITGEGDFSDLPALEEVTLLDVYVYFDGAIDGDYQKTIGWFTNCPSLKKVTVGSSFCRIGPEAFEGCHNLVEVVKEGGNWKNIEERAFYGCTSLKSFKWGSSKDLSIAEEAFANSGIHSVLIANGCKMIKSNSFTPLDTIYAANTTPPYAKFDFTDDQYLNIVVVVPPGSLAKYQAASPWDKFWNIVEGKMPTGGIEGVSIDTPATDEEMWYDLHGRRIDPASATPGLYIRRQGSTAS